MEDLHYRLSADNYILANRFVDLIGAAFTHNMLRYVPFFKIGVQAANIYREESAEQQCCGHVHDVELLHLCRRRQHNCYLQYVFGKFLERKCSQWDQHNSSYLELWIINHPSLLALAFYPQGFNYRLWI